MPVDAVTTDNVVAVLKPIWRTTPETASRLRGRIENILDAAKASKHIVGPWENPARWRGNLIHLLPRNRKKSQVRHHPAMPYDALPKFMARPPRLLTSEHISIRLRCYIKWSDCVVIVDAAAKTISAHELVRRLELGRRRGFGSPKGLCDGWR